MKWNGEAIKVQVRRKSVVQRERIVSLVMLKIFNLKEKNPPIERKKVVISEGKLCPLRERR